MHTAAHIKKFKWCWLSWQHVKQMERKSCTSVFLGLASEGAPDSKLPADRACCPTQTLQARAASVSKKPNRRASRSAHATCVRAGPGAHSVHAPCYRRGGPEDGSGLLVPTAQLSPEKLLYAADEPLEYATGVPSANPPSCATSHACLPAAAR